MTKLRNVARGLLLLLAVLALLLAFSLPAQAVSYDAEEVAFVALLNDYRVSQGLQPLLVSDMISEACDRHNSDMGKYGFFDHTTLASDWFPVGSTPWYRMEVSGYDYNTVKAENIAAGYSTATEVFDAWRKSPGHNENMLRSTFKVLGVSRVYVSGSHYGCYWTTDFGGYVDPTAHSLTSSTPTLTITSPSGTGSYASGSSLTVSWTSDRALSSGEFGVWVRSASQQWYIGQLVAATGGTSCSKTITLGLPAGSGYQVIVAYRSSSSESWGSWATGPGSFSVTPGLPYLSITSPSGPATYASGDPMTVSWTSDQVLTSGEFGVWVRSATQGWYIGQLVPATGGTSFSKAITLGLPTGSGYQVIVAYRPTNGSTWGSWCTSWWSFTVTPGLPYLTIDAPSSPGTYATSQSLGVSWTSDQSLSGGEFGVWVRSASGSWYIGQRVAATGGTNFSTNVPLSSLPPGSGYQVIVAYRATPGSGSWVSWTTGWATFTVTSG